MHPVICRVAVSLIMRTGGASEGFELPERRLMAAYRLLAAFLILKSSIRLPDRNCSTSQRGCLPRPAQVSDG